MTRIKRQEGQDDHEVTAPIAALDTPAQERFLARMGLSRLSGREPGAPRKDVPGPLLVLTNTLAAEENRHPAMARSCPLHCEALVLATRSDATCTPLGRLS